MTLLSELDKCCLPKSVNKILREEQVGAQDKSLIRKLYNLIHSRNYEEDQIVKKLYGAKITPSHGPFRTLKTRLRHVLVEAFVIQELGAPSYKSYDLALQNGYRQLDVARLLIIGKAFHAARDVALHAFKNVRDYEIIPLNQGLTDVIASLHLGIFYNEELYLKYSNLNRYYSKASYDLSKVSDYYREVRNGMYAKRESPKTVGQKAGEYLEASREISERYKHVSQIQGMLVGTEMTGCMLRGEYHEAIEASVRGIKVLMNCKGVSQSAISALAINRVECTIMLNDFKLGQQQILSARKEVLENTINDLALTDLAILLGLRTGNFEFAYRQFVNTNQRTVSRLLTSRHQEHWIIMEACINLLVAAGEITPEEDWPKLRKFRAASFVNKVISSTRNKKGENIQILVLQALFSIIRKKYDDAIDRTSGLEAYCNRYLKDNENLRNNCFFKLLLITIKAGFNRKQAERKGEATLRRMKAATDRSKLNNTELVPYETLWQIVLNHLKVSRAEEAELEAKKLSTAIT
jgi:hypothetical protein